MQPSQHDFWRRGRLLRSGVRAGLWGLALAGLVRAQAQPIEVWVPPFDDAQAGAMAALDRAQVSVDVAQYNIRSEAFHQKLLELRARGVSVRIVVDAKNAREPYNTLDDVLEAEGFALVRHENVSAAYAIMHHKFSVIDGVTVLTGSYNWNETAQYVNDENMLALHDPSLAAAYEAEFQELWTGAPDVAAVGSVAPAGVGLGGAVEVRFSPDDRPRDAVLTLIRGAQRRVRVAMFAFLDTQVARALADAAGRGVEVTLLTEKKQAENTQADETVAAAGGRVIVGANTSSPYSAMHEKFAIVDDEAVITGACNWTFTAFEKSNEDLLVIRDPAVVRRYTRAFAALVNRYDPHGYVAADYDQHEPEAALHLVVHAPLVRWGETVIVTGDHPALGNWDPSQGLALTTTDGIAPTWTGRVRLPAGAQVRWKALVRGPAGDTWELGDDRALTIDAFGTDLVQDTVFRSTVEVTLSATLVGGLAPGEELRLTGSDPLLGDWDPQRAWPLAADPAAPDTYTATVPLPGRLHAAVKLIKLAADGSVVWEQGDDRPLDVHDRDAPQAVDLGAFRE